MLAPTQRRHQTNTKVYQYARKPYFVFVLACVLFCAEHSTRYANILWRKGGGKDNNVYVVKAVDRFFRT